MVAKCGFFSQMKTRAEEACFDLAMAGGRDSRFAMLDKGSVRVWEILPLWHRCCYLLGLASTSWTRGTLCDVVMCML